MIREARRLPSPWLPGIAASLGAALLIAGCTESGDEVQAPDLAAPTGTRGQAATEQPGGLTIQLLPAADIAGNARVTVTSNPVGQDKPPPYLVVGQTENPIILRDDGMGADLQAGDLVYSAFTFVDTDTLTRRNIDETNLIKTFQITSVPTFDGRTESGEAAAVAFDIDSFNRGLPVAFNPSAILAAASPAPSKSLLINDPSVVGAGDPTRTWDPCSGTGTKLGAFTFGHLMTEMANQPLTGIDPSTFAMLWLKTWLVNQTVNTFNVPARPNMATTIINPWLAASGGVKLDLGIAPFRLLAIVNRLDLRTGSGGYGGGTGDAGETRFVFGAVIPGRTCQLLPFTVIFEYGVPIRGCFNVRSWAQQWINLNSLVLGSAAYNAALQAITDQVVLRNAAPLKPNGSALNQLRTNEIAIGSPWELRQFNLLSAIDLLHETPVFRTPDVQFNAQDPNWNLSTTLDAYIVANKVPIDNGTHVVPLSIGTTPFLGGAAPVTFNNVGYFWNTSTLDLDPTHVGNWNQERHLFSLNTCQACHAGETLTPFTHISPTTPIGSPAALSGFLTGEMVPDAAFGSPTRPFHDLLRRQLDLVGVANASCAAFPLVKQELVDMALRGDPLPKDLVVEPVDPVSKQGTFFIEDFAKPSIQGH